ncbi:CcdC protein domain-containing protein [Cohnella fermenti]|uniref:DUF1453 family protein n=1 Tax=Cohnella fermenti TaxID=2565925 RepID=A0A4S4BGI4_9BACL|nr:CcdC protein domain-containing protein [Cohnella fermenti]THF73549.1 DUF1453 family protein [Cohnella fermenti]
MTITTWLEILLILAIAVWTQMGKRAFTTRRIVMPFIVAVVVGRQYLGGFPEDGHNLLAFGLCVLAGVVFGALLVLATRLERGENGVLYTKAGWGYFAVWVLELGLRVAFAYYAQSHQMEVGSFLVRHQLSPDMIGTGFIAMTIATLLTRVLGILLLGKARTGVRSTRTA